MANNALQPSPQPRVARLRFPRSPRSLGAAERRRYADDLLSTAKWIR
jgi:hypothetical protein